MIVYRAQFNETGLKEKNNHIANQIKQTSRMTCIYSIKKGKMKQRKILHYSNFKYLYYFF